MPMVTDRAYRSLAANSVFKELNARIPVIYKLTKSVICAEGLKSFWLLHFETIHYVLHFNATFNKF